MKTKHYEFTETEMTAIREALVEYYHNVSKKHCDPLSPLRCSPIAKSIHLSVKALKDQFKQDCCLIR